MGIPQDKLAKIFEPFYTSKSMGRSGTGLGMTVVWGTVKDHGGYLDVESSPENGTIITVFLPVLETGIEQLTEAESMPEASPMVMVKQFCWLTMIRPSVPLEKASFLPWASRLQRLQVVRKLWLFYERKKWTLSSSI